MAPQPIRTGNPKKDYFWNWAREALIRLEPRAGIGMMRDMTTRGTLIRKMVGITRNQSVPVRVVPLDVPPQFPNGTGVWFGYWKDENNGFNFVNIDRAFYLGPNSAPQVWLSYDLTAALAKYSGAAPQRSQVVYQSVNINTGFPVQASGSIPPGWGIGRIFVLNGPFIVTEIPPSLIPFDQSQNGGPGYYFYVNFFP